MEVDVATVWPATTTESASRIQPTLTTWFHETRLRRMCRSSVSPSAMPLEGPGLCGADNSMGTDWLTDRSTTRTSALVEQHGRPMDRQTQGRFKNVGFSPLPSQAWIPDTRCAARSKFRQNDLLTPTRKGINYVRLSSTRPG